IEHVYLLRHLYESLVRVRTYLCNDRSIVIFEFRNDIISVVVDALALDADGIDHSAPHLAHPRRHIATPRVFGDTFRYNRPELIENQYFIHFMTECTSCRHDRVFNLQTADIIFLVYIFNSHNTTSSILNKSTSMPDLSV